MTVVHEIAREMTAQKSQARDADGIFHGACYPSLSIVQTLISQYIRGVTRWLIPTLGYVVTLGALGVTSKLALRSVPWQGLVAVATFAYLFATAAMVSMGQVQLSSNIDLFWAAVTAVLTVGSLVLLYVALGAGEATKVIPVSAAYPAVTLILSAIFLGEAFTAGRALGVLLVIGGVVVLSAVK